MCQNLKNHKTSMNKHHTTVKKFNKEVNINPLHVKSTHRNTRTNKKKIKLKKCAKILKTIKQASSYPLNLSW